MNLCVNNIWRSIQMDQNNSKNIQVFCTHTDSLTTFLKYTKWHSKNIIKGEVEEEVLENDELLNEEYYTKLLYLRAMFKDDKEHVYALDGILNNPYKKEMNEKYMKFYQKL